MSVSDAAATGAQREGLEPSKQPIEVLRQVPGEPWIDPREASRSCARRRARGPWRDEPRHRDPATGVPVDDDPAPDRVEKGIAMSIGLGCSATA